MEPSDCSRGGPAELVVVGAGAAGTLTAVRLVRSDPRCRVTLVDPTRRPGRGLAYGTTDRAHLLNVRAGRMSAHADEPEHFVDWARARDRRVRPEDFLPRAVYGDYLTELLDDAVRTGRVRVVRGRAVDAEVWATAVRVHTSAGRLDADGAVLALGNAAPAALPWETDHAGEPWCVPDPWVPGVLDGLPATGTVLLAGTGLTAVDVALSLARAPGRRVLAVSRHGLLPARHLAGPEPVWPTTVPAGTASLRTGQLVALLRAEVAAAAAAGVDWRAVVDGLRPAVAGLWARLPEDERCTFLRHVARFWEIHRHRMAPEVAARIDGMRRVGRFEVRAGRPVEAVPDAAGCRVRIAGPGGASWLPVAAVVNCTGPRADPTVSPDPFVRALVARGLVRPGPQRLGLDVGAGGRLVDHGGRVHNRLLAIGALRKGQLWETTAVPEIRQQAADLAACLTRHLTPAQSFWMGA